MNKCGRRDLNPSHCLIANSFRKPFLKKVFAKQFFSQTFFSKKGFWQGRVLPGYTTPAKLLRQFAPHTAKVLSAPYKYCRPIESFGQNGTHARSNQPQLT